MNRPRIFSSISDFLAAFLCIAFAAALQIQITLFQSTDYLGLRINLGDILIPLAGLGILYTLLRKQSLWPQWQMGRTYIWLAGLTAILTAALVQTHFTYGEISRWALVNKYGGWFILIALFGLGGWIGTNARLIWVERFLKIFLYFGLAVMALDITAAVGQSYLREALNGFTYANYPIAGYMVNRNAFALLFLTIFALSTCQYFSGTNLLKRWYSPALFFLIPFFLIFNGSRAMMIALGLSCAIMVALNIRNNPRKIGTLVLSFLLGGLLFGAIYHDRKEELFVLKGRQLNFVSHLGGVVENKSSPESQFDELEYPGDSMRLTILTDAKEMIAVRPVTGSGLGSMLLYQEKKHGQIINLIDCTPVWLLVETGLIGLLAFAAFYVQSFRALYMQWKQDEGFIRAFRLGIIAAMGCFTLMSLFHEIMYTRFVWVLLGMGLTLRTRPAE